MCNCMITAWWFPEIFKSLISGTSECYFTWKRDFTDAIIVRILRWEDDPRLLSWALNAVNKKDPYKKDAERNLTTNKRKCNVATEAERKGNEIWKGSPAKECRWSPENRNDKRRLFLRTSKGTILVYNTLISLLQDSCLDFLRRHNRKKCSYGKYKRDIKLYIQ